MSKDKNAVHELVLKSTPESFEEIVRIVENARERAYRRVNEELILTYQEIGKYLSEKSKETSYGSNYIENVADFFAQNYPDLKGFTRRGLYRMKQFYEVYKDDEKVTTLLTHLSWTNHLKIMSGSKSPEERRFSNCANLRIFCKNYTINSFLKNAFQMILLNSYMSTKN